MCVYNIRVLLHDESLGGSICSYGKKKARSFWIENERFDNKIPKNKLQNQNDKTSELIFFSRSP